MEKVFPKLSRSNLGGNFIEKLIQESAKKATLIDLEISGNPKFLPFVRRILAAGAVSLSVSDGYMNDVKLAVTEACTNVIKHAFKYDQTKKFGLSIQISNELCVIKVIYEDGNFAPDKIPTPDFSQIQEGGLGVFIMRNTMDDVVYSVDSKTGSIVLRMIKLLAPLTNQEK